MFNQRRAARNFSTSKFIFLIFSLLLGLAFCIFLFKQTPVPVRAQENRIPPEIIRFSQNFDGVTVPLLPAGWVQNNSGVNTGWVTNSTSADTSPNSAFTPNPDNEGGADLTSPAITINGNSAKLSFRNFYDTENTWDGCVLEISVNGGQFQDILAAGGTFLSGGYTGTLRGMGNPLANRQGWTGNSNNFITTTVQLPPTALRTPIRLRWRIGHDDIIGDTGWRIDSVTITTTLSGENTAAISIPPSGIASPYPSEIQIEGHDGLVTGVTVYLENFSHSAPDDLDLMLVAPNGRKVILMSDVGGSNPVSNLSLIIDETAANSFPDNSPVISGTYKPTNFEPGDVFPPPAPAGAPTGNKLSILNGSPPNGAWRLFLVDDNGENAGNISGGWGIAVQSSPEAIMIPEVGISAPYPANYSVSNMIGSVSKVTVNINNFSHNAPDDVDLMLMAPNGRRIILMSDVGGSIEAGNVNLVFDDDATTELPDNGQLVSGTFKPTNFEQGDIFPAPAPAGAPTGTTLNHFYGVNPNGVWKLFLVDDAGANFGSIVSWNLNITASLSACLFDLSPAIQSFPITGGAGQFQILIPAGCPWEAVSQSGFVTINSASSGEGNGAVSFTVAPNMEGGRTGTILISGGGTTRAFSVQQPSGCPFSVAQEALNFSVAGGNGSLLVTAGTSCGWLAQSNANWINITSGQQTGNGNATFTVAANPTANQRTATITIGARTVTVNQAGTTGKRFDFDGDGKADVSVYRPSSGIWYVLASQNNSLIARQFGVSTDKIVPGDYDGDRKTDFAVFRDGAWFIFESQNSAFRAVNWGTPTDIPTPGDYDGDGKTDLGVFRPGDQNWYILRSGNNSLLVRNFGLAADKPVPADYDGDGRTDIAIYRPGATVGAVSSWAILKSSNSSVDSQQFGINGDIAVPGDFDGDGRDQIAVFRSSNGTWYTSTDPATNYGAKQWGAAGDVPVAADYNGDGRTDFAVFRNGNWFILHAGSETSRTEGWGLATDKPVPSAFSAQ